MITIDEFVELLRGELGLPLTEADTELDLDQVPGWDSVHLLALLSVLEQRTGAPISLPDVLAATSLRDVHTVVCTSAPSPRPAG
ncbi:Acyl carrier protein [Frankia canadensis]|uniref:Acyl carrier protein n=1 Tax=Frankia canadensis TaxID=1836972 RepID=A0A2I2KRM9_9ACTN|nr:acyl carrier protein [Frankia canadensis]SNQ48328.1 Acyl carrier protein [Frankia canadensis]SOU55618.1 Acyl carrier protein [Frankia canadensis]